MCEGFGVSLGQGEEVGEGVIGGGVLGEGERVRGGDLVCVCVCVFIPRLNGFGDKHVLHKKPVCLIPCTVYTYLYSLQLSG